jgi:DNA primase
MNAASDAKEKIRQLLDLADVISEVVVLKPAGGGRLKGLCPFHSEKTPSFNVNRDRGFYYCFGCQAKGDVFDFVMQTRGLTFPEALQKLGAQVGVEVAVQAPADRKRADLYRVNAMALEYFRSHLAGAALDYLRRRKLTAESVGRFRLGYAPEGWDGLLQYAAGRGFDSEALVAAGLVIEADSGRRYDRFRDRVIFPINDYMGRVTGFAGRILDQGEPKYLNTPETDIFHKGSLLYALDLARPEIRKSGECIVVEGYMDVIALHQAGMTTAVAALGASLTSEQGALLDRQGVRKLFLAFDADQAGQRAVLAGLDQSVGQRFLVRAVSVPEGRDPADVVLDDGPEAFRAALDAGLSEVEYRFQAVTERHDARTEEGRRLILNELLPALRTQDVFDPVASELKRLVVHRLGIDEALLTRLVSSGRRERVNVTQLRGMERRSGAGTQLKRVEVEIMALLLLERGGLRKRLELLRGALPETEDSLLAEFMEVCERFAFDDRLILDHYRERDEGAILFGRLLEMDGAEEPRTDLDEHIGKSLSRLRELSLNEAKELQRSHILERMTEVSSLLSQQDLPVEQLQQYYAELEELAALLAARDAERRLRVGPGPGRRGR